MTTPRSLHDFSKAEARHALDTYVAALPARAAAFVEAVREAGGPYGQLDYSRESLVPAWIWLLTDPPVPAQPVDDAVMRASDPPWWYDYRPQDGQAFGPVFARRVTILCAYAGAVALRHRPGARFELEARRSAAYRNWPVLITDQGSPWPLEPVLANLAERYAVNGLRLDPTKLLQSYDIFTGFAAAPLHPEPAAGPDYEFGEAPEWGPLTYQVYFDDVVAHEQEARVERFVERLAAQPIVTEVIHQDTEDVIIVVTNGTGVEELVARTWKEVQ
ncbi:MAG: hypothetical protein ACYC65_04465 [Candidatus Limnocylindrales bacterium]